MAVSPRIPAEHALACRHAEGAGCLMQAAGHELHLMQLRLAAATPGKWVDAIVTRAGEDGWVELAGLTGEPLARVWHHESLRSVAPEGTPVALHAVYHVLAAGVEWFNVRDERAA